MDKRENPLGAEVGTARAKAHKYQACVQSVRNTASASQKVKAGELSEI